MLELLISLLILVLVGAVIYWIIGLIPMPPILRTVVLVIFAVIFLLYFFSYLPLPAFHHEFYRR